MTARAARRSQAGVTLVEILLAIGISAVVLGPLTAWAVLVVGQRNSSQNEMARTNATGLLTTYLSRDVASAALVRAGGSDCTGGGGGSAGSVRLQLVPAGADRRVVYTEAAPTDSDPVATRSLWRRVCDATGAVTSAAEVVPGIRPASTQVACPSAAAAAGDPCQVDDNRQVQVRVVPLAADGTDARPIEVRAFRRTSAASTGSPSVDNRPPLAQVAASPELGYLPTRFRFDATESRDFDGTVAAYDWTFPAGASCTPSAGGAVQECTFSGVTDQLVTLTVTDERGASNSAAVTVRVLNRYPAAAAAATPTTGAVGTTTFLLDASGSADPDGEGLTYRWDLGEDLGPSRFLEGPTPAVVFPPGSMLGPRQITLVVTDPEGATDTSVVVVELTAEASDPGGVSVVGDVVFSPALVTTSGRLPRHPEPVGPGLPEQSLTFSDRVPLPPGSTATWRLQRRGSGEVVATSAEPAYTHRFGPDDGGEYQVVRIVQPPEGPAVEGAPAAFRVNAAPTAAFASSGGGAAPRSVSFDPGASSDDGRIVSWRWNFGFFNFWTSTNPTPTHTFSDPGTYTVRLEVIDDDGARSTTTQQIVVTGTPRTPPPPAWDGLAVTVDPVPGVEQYVVMFTYQCGNPLIVNLSPSPAPRALAQDPAERCSGFPPTVSATVQLRANGVLGEQSSPAVRP